MRLQVLWRCPVLTLRDKLDEMDSSARLQLATNRSTPGDILCILATDPSEQVRLAVAKNPATPHHVVARLAKDESQTVRLGLAADSHCPVELLQVLADDADERVRETARETWRALRPTYKHIFNVAFS